MVTILQGDCLEVLKTLPAKSVQCVVTSPPYYGLRDYGTAKWDGGDAECDHKVRLNHGQDKSTLGGNPRLTQGHGQEGYKEYCHRCGAIRKDGQIGLEQTPEEYVEKLVVVFREVRRVLRDDGTVWLNLGDSYASAWASGRRNKIGNGSRDNRIDRCTNTGLKEKDLIGIPWRVAFALQADGWWLRSDIIWHKLNPMPESVKDRPTKSHEYVFLLSKSAKYYYDGEAVKEPSVYPNDNRKSRVNDTAKDFMRIGNKLARGSKTYPFRNNRSVWTISTSPYKGAHFATYPPKLVEPCILAGSKEGDVVLDPFCGSGTTGEVAIRYGRDFIGIELNPEYIELAKKRLSEFQMRLKL